MAKECCKNGCNNPQFGGGYCLWHQWCRTDKPKKSRLKNYSQKRQRSNRRYLSEARIFRQDNPICAIQSPECTSRTEEVHHVKGRIGDLLLDQRFWLPCCVACNRYMERFDEWARERGFKQLRNSV